MRVKHVNDYTKEFDGKRYYRQKNMKKGRYYRRREGDTSVSLHRAVWRYYYGDIPENCHIHHTDHNWHNNQIENLVLLKASDHRTHHWSSEEKRAAQAKRVVKYATPKAKEWHGTEEGRKWHSEHGRAAYAKREPIEKECAACHIKYQTLDRKKAARFCSANCKMNARRRRLRGLPEDAPRDML